ncbi:hypothetical protein ACIO3O_36925 [Streptomyces sp. NPDC087440]|uniref:hypothetical protein n=1 Tax=Streptomyces sp. NPDC087440 TaxID=3365790 RepID=UPI00382D8779
MLTGQGVQSGMEKAVVRLRVRKQNVWWVDPVRDDRTVSRWDLTGLPTLWSVEVWRQTREAFNADRLRSRRRPWLTAVHAGKLWAALCPDVPPYCGGIQVTAHRVSLILLWDTPYRRKAAEAHARRPCEACSAAVHRHFSSRSGGHGKT